MTNPHPDSTPETVYVPFGAYRWRVTMQTPAGPVTAKGATIGDARRALDDLLANARARAVMPQRSQR